MATGVNQCNFVGHLGDNSVLRYTQKGVAVMSCRIACGERYRNSEGEWVERTEWVPIVLFGKRAEGLSKLLLKGSRIYTSGQFRTRSYEDQKGVTRYVTEIRASEVVPLSTKGRQVADPEAEATPTPSDDDVPQ